MRIGSKINRNHLKSSVERILKNNRKLFLIAAAVFSCAVFLLYIIVLFIPVNRIDNPGGIEIVIKRGMSPGLIADVLLKEGVIRNRSSFLLGAKLIGVSRKLKAGRYRFGGRVTNYFVIRKLFHGDVIKVWVTIPEGSRVSKIAEILNKKFGIDIDYFMRLVNDTSLCNRFGIDGPNLEGYLYPDTYCFNIDVSSETILETMVSRFKEIFCDSLRKRAEEMGFSVHEVVTLASIVEGEAMLDSERKTIASLYLNRLKKNMLLQADPTIQYIIKNGPRRLLEKDLMIDSPYNTYIHRGLPPGPINNPGLASIMAVLYPSKEDYLFMVANGDGSHTFSKTISDHIAAKRRFDRIRKEQNHQF